MAQPLVEDHMEIVRLVAVRTRAIGAVRHFLLEVDIQVAEVFCAAGNIWWVIVLFMVDDLHNAPASTVVDAIGSTLWRVISTLVMFVTMWAVWHGLLQTRKVLWARRMALQVYFCYYLTITVALAALNPRTIGLGLHFGLALAAAWCYLRLGPRARCRKCAENRVE